MYITLFVYTLHYEIRLYMHFAIWHLCTYYILYIKGPIISGSTADNILELCQHINALCVKDILFSMSAIKAFIIQCYVPTSGQQRQTQEENRVIN